MKQHDLDAVDALQNFDATNLEKLLKDKPVVGAAAAAAGQAIPYFKEYCAAKPILVKLLPLVKEVPIFGKRVSQLVELLMRIADGVCGCK